LKISKNIPWRRNLSSFGQDETHSQEKSSSPFQKSAKVYDQLYRQKDYYTEFRFYEKWLNVKNQKIRNILEWGCGTGALLQMFSNHGWNALGIDPSDEMRKIAQCKGLPVLNGCLHNGIEVGELSRNSSTVLCELQTFAQTNCVATAPFAVLSYAGLTNELLLSSLATVRKWMTAGNRFAFDVVHAAAAETSLIRSDTRESIDHNMRIIRSRIKSFDSHRFWVTHDMKFKILNELGEITDEWEEQHILKAFRPSEIETALLSTSFKVI
jgi:predicted TPR repeat methyltransferase